QQRDRPAERSEQRTFSVAHGARPVSAMHVPALAVAVAQVVAAVDDGALFAVPARNELTHVATVIVKVLVQARSLLAKRGVADLQVPEGASRQRVGHTAAQTEDSLWRASQNSVRGKSSEQPW